MLPIVRRPHSLANQDVDLVVYVERNRSPLRSPRTDVIL